jgi:hypothetical protein
VKMAKILDSTQTSIRHSGLQATGIESTVVFPMLPGPALATIQDDRVAQKLRQRQKLQAKAALLPQLTAKAAEKRVSLFAYLADLVRGDVGTRRFLSLE